MKILEAKTFHKVIFTIKAGAKLVVCWRSAQKKLGATAHDTISKSSIHCIQEAKLERDHDVDAAWIVQLNRSEASSLGLKTALGVIQGEGL